MYHSVTAISPTTVFLFGGRVSPARPLLTYGMYELQEGRLCPEETYTLSSLDCEPAPRWRHRAIKCGGLLSNSFFLLKFILHLVSGASCFMGFPRDPFYWNSWQ